MYDTIKDTLLPQIEDLVLEAGELIMEIYSNFDGEVVIKKDDSPLTLADQRANAHIVKRLAEITPEWPIISEENKLQAYEERQSFDYFWVVDPLDGTKEFIKRNGEFTVNIALCRKNKPILGVVGVPVSRTIYSAQTQRGAHKLLGAERNRIQCRAFDPNAKGLVFVTSRSHINDATNAFLEQFDEPSTKATGSSLKFMLIAEGKADCYPRLGPTMEWDTAAAHIIVEEAGGEVIQAETDQPLMYNKENLLNPHFVVLGKKK